MKIYVDEFVPLPPQNYLGYVKDSTIRIPFVKGCGGDMVLKLELPPAMLGKEMLIVEKGGVGYIEVDYPLDKGEKVWYT